MYFTIPGYYSRSSNHCPPYSSSSSSSTICFGFFSTSSSSSTLSMCALGKTGAAGVCQLMRGAGVAERANRTILEGITARWQSLVSPIPSGEKPSPPLSMSGTVHPLPLSRVRLLMNYGTGSDRISAIFACGDARLMSTFNGTSAAVWDRTWRRVSLLAIQLDTRAGSSTTGKRARR